MPTIPSWMMKIIAPIGIALGLLLALFGYGKAKEAEGKQELKDEINEGRLDAIKENEKSRDRVRGMPRDERIAELQRDKT